MAKLSIVKVRCDREVNAYVVAAGKEAVIIDPGAPPEKIAGQLEGLTVKWIVASHGHPGHLAGKDALKELTGATTAMHMADAKLLLRSADRYVLDGDELPFGDLTLRVLHTPGHTPGSLCFLAANHCFCGDTLLAQSIGKQTPDTDLRQLSMSLGRLLQLPLNTALYPGHGPATSVEAELRSNPYLRPARA